MVIRMAIWRLTSWRSSSRASARNTRTNRLTKWSRKQTRTGMDNSALTVVLSVTWLFCVPNSEKCKKWEVGFCPSLIYWFTCRIFGADQVRQVRMSQVKRRRKSNAFWLPPNGFAETKWKLWSKEKKKSLLTQEPFSKKDSFHVEICIHSKIISEINCSKSDILWNDLTPCPLH